MDKYEFEISLEDVLNRKRDRKIKNSAYGPGFNVEVFAVSELDPSAFDTFTLIIDEDNSPYIYDEEPFDNMFYVERPTAELNVTVEDYNGDYLSIIFRWLNQTPIINKWDNLCEWNDVNNGTYSFTPPIINDWIWGDTKYTWSVNVTDGSYWTNKTFTFTTGGSRYDVSNNDIVNFQDAGLCWVNRDSVVDYDGLYDVNQNGAVNFQDAGLCWINRE